MINKINISAQPASINFKAVKIAKTQSFVDGIKTEIDIYRLSHKDCPFLNNLAQTVEPARLVPKDAQKHGFERWKEIFFYAVENAMRPEYRSYLAVTKNKPCGLINFKTMNKDTHVECICTWPVKINEKVKFAGKSLFNQVLEYHKKAGSDKITIEAIVNGHSHPLERYIELGFVPVRNLDHTVAMEMSKKTTEKLQKRFAGYFTSTPSETGKEINLNKSLNLDF